MTYKSLSPRLVQSTEYIEYIIQNDNSTIAPIQ